MPLKHIPHILEFVRLSNIEIATALNLSQSTVSRMRSGQRLASLETLQLIAQQYSVEPSILLAAAAKASQGDRSEWIKVLNQIFDDGEPDPDEGLGDPESAITPEFSN